MPPTQEIARLNLATGTISEQSDATHPTFHARFVRAGVVRGRANQDSDIEMSASGLEEAVLSGLFDNKAVFVDHAGWLDNGPSLDSLVGHTINSAWNEYDQAVEGKIVFYNTPGAKIATQLISEILDAGEEAPDIGLSIVFYPTWESDPATDRRVITGIRHVDSVDLVFQPAADGRILQALSTFHAHQSLVCHSERSEESSPPLGHIHAFNPQSLYSLAPIPGVTPQENPIMTKERAPYSNSNEEESINNSQLDIDNPRLNPPSPWLSAMRQAGTQAMLNASGLPQVSRDRLGSFQYDDPQDLQDAIDAEVSYLATLNEESVIQVGGTPPRQASITGMSNSLDRLTMAAEALFAGIRPASGIQPLSGIRELYHLLSGDFEMNGVFQPERIQFANVNSSTMAGIVANALNKRVVNEFQMYPQWWKPISSEEDFTSLQEVKWITMGGVGELPTVAEGAAYTELTWDDNTETATFAKKGGYLGLTLEAIDKDDTGRIRSAPRALAQAAWLTLSKSISAIFTQSSGLGPTMADSIALFNASHSNLGTTALSFAEYTAVRTAMRKQTELHSSERLGALTAPKYLLVPPDLEITALQILASEGQPGTANNDENPFAEGNEHQARMASARERVIVVDLWTDTNNWAAACDPRLYPTIGIAYRYGRTPEIFSVASPTAGLMFTNDTMPIKVRFFYATGPMDYRGLYKENVA